MLLLNNRITLFNFAIIKTEHQNSQEDLKTAKKNSFLKLNLEKKLISPSSTFNFKNLSRSTHFLIKLILFAKTESVDNFFIPPGILKLKSILKMGSRALSTFATREQKLFSFHQEKLNRN